MPDYKDLFTDPNFLAGLGQIVSGVMGAGSVGQGIGEANRFRQRQELDQAQLDEQKSVHQQQADAAANRDYLKLVEMKHEDYTKRKAAALVDVQKTVDAMDPTEYAKLPQILPKTLEPYQLDDSDRQQIAKNALGRVQSKDWTTFNPKTGERNVAPDSPDTIFMTRKEAILAERDYKKAQLDQEKQDEATKKTIHANLVSELKNAARVPGAAEKLLGGLDENIISRVEAQGIVSGEQALMAKEQAQLKLTEQQTRTSAAQEARANRPDSSKLKDDEKSALADAVIAQPALFDAIGTEGIRQIAPMLNSKGFVYQGKAMNETALTKIAESKSALMQLNDLKSTLIQYKDYLGPVTGLSALNPYSDAKKAQAVIELVKQRVGKALEGGVLRAEDTAKYKKILSEITDTPSTAFFKVDNLIENVSRDLDNYVSVQGAGGRNISGVKSDTTPFPEGANSPVKVVDFEWDPKTKKAKKVSK